MTKADEAAVDAMLTMVNSPDSATGTPDQVVEKLQRMAVTRLRVRHLHFPEAAYDRSGIELFEQEVIPALQLIRDRRDVCDGEDLTDGTGA